MHDRAVLHAVENDRRITEEADAGFLYLLHNAVLLALKEAGRLNETQYRYAEEELKIRYRKTP